MKFKVLVKHILDEDMTSQEKNRKWQSLLDKLRYKMLQCQLECDYEKKEFISKYGSPF
jgi:hypothetical protein